VTTINPRSRIRHKNKEKIKENRSPKEDKRVDNHEIAE
jgi:hypothetical protein